MIKEDRIQLNQRFIKVFDLLEEKGVIKKNDRNGKGVGDVAERILGNKGYGHIVRAFLDGDNKRVIDYAQARAFCRTYGVNEDYMIEGVGSPFDDMGRHSNFEMYNNIETGRSGNILFTSVEAFAGTAVDVSSFNRESSTYFSLPGIGGNGLVAFPINGNSMEPVISDGDIVICREVSSINDVHDNDIYAVRTNGSVWVKYVQKITQKSGRVAKLKLLSANYLEHDPFEEEVNDYTKLYKVVRRVSSL